MVLNFFFLIQLINNMILEPIFSTEIKRVSKTRAKKERKVEKYKDV